jgi:outer membrane protein assembly factor BamB
MSKNLMSRNRRLNSVHAVTLGLLMAATWSSVAASVALAADWGRFRGPNGQGIAAGEGYPTEWGPQKNIRWRSELPGQGNGSAIVAAGRVFVTTAQDKGRRRTLHAFDRTTGQELWSRAVEFPQVEKTHGTNPFAATTPASDGESVVVWHGSAGLFCYDMAGKERWSIDLGDVGHIWGYGSSPIIHDGRVFVNFGPGVETFVAAVSLKDGELLWKTVEPGGTNNESGRYVGSWSTPVVIHTGGKDELLCSMPKRVVCYDPQDGSILWTVGGVPGSGGELVYTSPLVTDAFGVVMGGFKGPSLGFKLGGSGDVTETNRLWLDKQGQPQRIGSGVIVGEHIYMANAGPGTIECIELKTGEVTWTERAGSHWGSIALADGLLYATDQNSVTRVFRPNPEKFEQVAENKLPERSNATPAFSDGEIFQRT